MGWFDFVRSPGGTSVETLRIPLFPLNTVLFPGGLQPLKIFEQRYLDMAAACMKANTPFGICLIDKGGEVGAAAVPHAVGTLATVGRWEMEQLEGTVELLAESPPTPLPQERERLLPLLQRIVSDLGTERIPEPHRFDNAEWVGYRITEVLPIQNLAKQKLLELDDPLTRLEILEKYLNQRKLLG